MSNDTYLSDFLNCRLPLQSAIIERMSRSVHQFERDPIPAWRHVADHLGKNYYPTYLTESALNMIVAHHPRSSGDQSEAFFNRYCQLRGSSVGRFIEACDAVGLTDVSNMLRNTN